MRYTSILYFMALGWAIRWAGLDKEAYEQAQRAYRSVIAYTTRQIANELDARAEVERINAQLRVHGHDCFAAGCDLPLRPEERQARDDMLPSPA